jgi:flagellar protein FlaG
MAIEGVKSFVAASTYQPVQPAKVQASEETAEKLDTEKSTVGQPVEIKKTDESSGGQNQEGAADQQGAKKQMDETEIAQKLKEINKKINNNTVAEFGMHEGTNRITIKLRDKDTDEIIKEFPAEKTLDLIQKAWELAGILVDERR